MSQPPHNDLSAPEERAPEEQNKGNSQQLLQHIANELRQRRGKEAVRVFLEGHAQGLIPAHDQLVHWLIQRLGDEETRRLLAACAHFPCAACDRGLETCPVCDGSGIRAEGMICESCIGGGRVRCDFCAGSGLATYNLFPPPLRRFIISHRVRIARRELDKLPSMKLPSDAPALLNTVLNANKLWCVLENAVTAAKSHVAEHPDAASSIDPLIADCRQSATRLEQFIRNTLAALASALEAASAGDQADPEQSQSDQLKADFHRSLGERETFQRTLLHHPLIDEKV